MILKRCIWRSSWRRQLNPFMELCFESNLSTFSQEATKNPKRLPVVLVDGGITMSQINTVVTGDLREVAHWLSHDNNAQFNRHR